PSEQLDTAGALLLGEALYELGAFDASEQVLAAGQGLPSNEHITLRLAVTRAKNAQWGLCQPEKALAINAAAPAVVTSAELREELVADEASVLTFSGHPNRALAVLGQITGTDQRTRVVRAIAGAIALATAGQTAEAAALSRARHPDHLALGDEPAIPPPALHVLHEGFAPTQAGPPPPGRPPAPAPAAASVPPVGAAVHRGRAALRGGRGVPARRFYAEAAGLAQSSRFAGSRRVALSGLAMAHAMLGEPDAAAQALAERAAAPAFGFLGP